MVDTQHPDQGDAAVALKLPMVVELQDQLLSASTDLERLTTLLGDAAEQLLSGFGSAHAHLDAHLQREGMGAQADGDGVLALASIRDELQGAAMALQFQDMASQPDRRGTRCAGCGGWRTTWAARWTRRGRRHARGTRCATLSGGAASDGRGAQSSSFADRYNFDQERRPHGFDLGSRRFDLIASDGGVHAEELRPRGGRGRRRRRCAREAAAQLQCRPALTDQNMPRMDGLTLARELRSNPQYRRCRS
jgi:CheY-like chemotaxis protein